VDLSALGSVQILRIESHTISIARPNGRSTFSGTVGRWTQSSLFLWSEHWTGYVRVDSAPAKHG